MAKSGGSPQTIIWMSRTEIKIAARIDRRKTLGMKDCKKETRFSSILKPISEKERKDLMHIWDGL